MNRDRLLQIFTENVQGKEWSFSENKGLVQRAPKALKKILKNVGPDKKLVSEFSKLIEKEAPKAWCNLMTIFAQSVIEEKTKEKDQSLLPLAVVEEEICQPWAEIKHNLIMKPAA